MSGAMASGLELSRECIWAELGSWGNICEGVKEYRRWLAEGEAMNMSRGREETGWE